MYSVLIYVLVLPFSKKKTFTVSLILWSRKYTALVSSQIMSLSVKEVGKVKWNGFLNMFIVKKKAHSGENNLLHKVVSLSSYYILSFLKGSCRPLWFVQRRQPRPLHASENGSFH